MSDYDLHINKGELFYNNGHLEAAIDEFDQAIKLKPNYPAAYCNRGLMHYHLNDYKRAIDDFNKSIELQEDNPLAYFNRGLAYKELKQFDKALADLALVKEYDPFDEEVDEVIASIKSVKDDPYGGISFRFDAYDEAEKANQNLDFERAVTLYTKSIKENTAMDFIPGYRGRGKAKRNAGDLRGAIKDFDRIIEIVGGDGDVFANRGLTKAQLGDYEEAMQDLIKAKELSPNDVIVYFGLGNLMMQLGGYKDALKNYDRLIELTKEDDPNIGKAYYNRGNAKLKLDDKEGAYRDWGIAVSHGHPQAGEMLKKN